MLKSITPMPLSSEYGINDWPGTDRSVCDGNRCRRKKNVTGRKLSPICENPIEPRESSGCSVPGYWAEGNLLIFWPVETNAPKLGIQPIGTHSEVYIVIIMKQILSCFPHSEVGVKFGRTRIYHRWYSHGRNYTLSMAKYILTRKPFSPSILGVRKVGTNSKEIN